MTKMHVSVLLACLLMAGSAMAGPTVTVKRNSGYFQGDGGEFTLTPNADLATLLGSPAKFESFCLEIGEHVDSTGVTYSVELNDEALQGGGNSGATGDEGGDPLSDKTAYLYSEFRAGTLTGYNYDVGPNRAASAKALQDVIWYLEDEAGMMWTAGSLQDTFYQAAIVATTDGWTNDGSIIVLNLYDQQTHAYQQDMIGMTATVPAPGAIVLGTLGSCFVGFLRRRHMM